MAVCTLLALSLVAFSDNGGEPAPRPVALDVTSTVGDAEADGLEEEVGARVAAQLGRYDVEIEPRAAVRLTVALRWRDDARTTYALDVALARQGEVMARDQRFCELCGSAALLEQVSFAVATVMLGDAPAPAPKPVQSQALTPSDPTRDPPAAARRSPPLTGLGWAGVAFAAGATALLSAGGVLWARGERTRPHREHPGEIVVRDDRPMGIALVAAGASSLAAGVAMVAVDAARQRRRRFAVAPQVDPRSVGVTVQGRF
jgi:hypothetical protein